MGIEGAKRRCTSFARFASAGARSEATRMIAEKVAAAAEAQTVAAAVAASGRQPHLSGVSLFNNQH